MIGYKFLSVIIASQVLSFCSGTTTFANEGRCRAVPGDWAWDTRAFPATIFEDGTVIANDGGKRISASWMCLNSERGQIVVQWDTGFTDTLTLSSDGRSLSGGNGTGANLVVIRR